MVKRSPVDDATWISSATFYKGGAKYVGMGGTGVLTVEVLDAPANMDDLCAKAVRRPKSFDQQSDAWLCDDWPVFHDASTEARRASHQVGSREYVFNRLLLLAPLAPCRFAARTSSLGGAILVNPSRD